MELLDTQMVGFKPIFKKFLFSKTHTFEKLVKNQIKFEHNSHELYYFIYFLFNSEFTKKHETIDDILKEHAEYLLNNITEKPNTDELIKNRNERYEDYSIYKNQIDLDDGRSKSEKYFMFSNTVGRRIFNNNATPVMEFGVLLMEFMQNLSLDYQQLFMDYITNSLDSNNQKKYSTKNYKKSSCFIATAVYGDPNNLNGLILRKFRDNYLQKIYLGKIFINFYYKVGPLISDIISFTPILKKIAKKFLNKLVNKIKNE